jgi:hypothetical protein
MMTAVTQLYSTGSILPLGDGLTGKSVITRLLINPDVTVEEHEDIILNTRKSLNIELEFASERINFGREEIVTSLQFYVFPGQRQKESKRITTFDEILSIFSYFPAMQKISVLLLVYDASRSHTLKSLEMWLKVALAQGWIHEKTLILLISNKIDLQEPNSNYIQQLLQGIYSMIKEKGIQINEYQVRSINTSCVTLEGLKLLRDEIKYWVAENGIQGIGSK